MGTSKRVIEVSERFYGVASYVAEKLGISRAKAVDRVLDGFLGREGAKLTHDSSDVPKLTLNEMSNRDLIRYGFNLMKEIEPDKIETLRERLNQIDSSFLEEIK